MSLHRRLRLFPPFQQALAVWLLLLLERLVSLWVMGALSQPTPGLQYWLPAVTGLLFWPMIQILLRGLGRRLEAA